jgi:hypothetical protein
MKAWDKFKVGSELLKAKAKDALRRKERKHVNKVKITEKEIASFKALEDLAKSVEELKSQAAANKLAYRKACKLQWTVLANKYELGGKFHYDEEAGELYQLGKRL